LRGLGGSAAVGVHDRAQIHRDSLSTFFFGVATTTITSAIT